MSGPHCITVKSFRRHELASTEAAVTAPATLDNAISTNTTAVNSTNSTAVDLEHQQPLLPPQQSPAAAAESKQLRKKIVFAQGLSWVVNIVLLLAKIYAFVLSGSKAVMASAADSAVDLISQVVISYTDWQMNRADPHFPVGQARLEALGVLLCASIMAIASFEVVAQSAGVLYEGLETGKLPELELGLVMYVVLLTATVAKLVCFVVCASLKSKSDSMMALAEDHLNDIMSNMAAVAAAALTQFVEGGWWFDPAFAMIISVWILWRWYSIARAQVNKLVGRTAPAEFIEELKRIADEHHEHLTVDCIRAYHFGTRYLVEMEVVLPPNWTLQQSHDVALMLQHKVEALEDVERAFVHTDYTFRDFPEHKVERTLGLRKGSGSGNYSAGEGRSGGGATAGV